MREACGAQGQPTVCHIDIRSIDRLEDLYRAVQNDLERCALTQPQVLSDHEQQLACVCAGAATADLDADDEYQGSMTA